MRSDKDKLDRMNARLFVSMPSEAGYA